jgi:hypothetical protein
MVGKVRFELTLSSFRKKRELQTSLLPVRWSEKLDSNQRYLASKASGYSLCPIPRNLVRRTGLEPVRGLPQVGLSHPRLPFRTAAQNRSCTWGQTECRFPNGVTASQLSTSTSLVRPGGLEPPRPLGPWLLRPSCLPVPAQTRNWYGREESNLHAFLGQRILSPPWLPFHHARMALTR